MATTLCLRFFLRLLYRDRPALQVPVQNMIENHGLHVYRQSRSEEEGKIDEEPADEQGGGLQEDDKNGPARIADGEEQSQ